MPQLRKNKAGETSSFSFMSYDRTLGKSDGIITVHRVRFRARSHKLKADNVKFRMFRQEFPEIGIRIDSIYHADPDRALFILKKLEEEQQVIRSAKEKRREIESAK